MIKYYFLIFLTSGTKSRADILTVNDGQNLKYVFKELHDRYKNTPVDIENIMIAESKEEAEDIMCGWNEYCTEDGNFLTVDESGVYSKHWVKRFKNRKKED